MSIAFLSIFPFPFTTFCSGRVVLLFFLMTVICAKTKRKKHEGERNMTARILFPFLFQLTLAKQFRLLFLVFAYKIMLTGRRTFSCFCSFFLFYDNCMQLKKSATSISSLCACVSLCARTRASLQCASSTIISLFGL